MSDQASRVSFSVPASWRPVAPVSSAVRGVGAEFSESDVPRETRGTRGRGGRLPRGPQNLAPPAPQSSEAGDVVAAWLAGSDLEPVATRTFTVEPDATGYADGSGTQLRRGRGGRGGAARDGRGDSGAGDAAGAAAAGSATVVVEVDATKHAVMLVEEEGVLRWILPVESAPDPEVLEATRRTRGARAGVVAPTRHVSFRFEATPGGADAAAGSAVGGRRGLGDMVRAARAITTRVFSYPADWLIGRVLDRLEPDAIEGPVDLSAEPAVGSEAESATEWTPGARPLHGFAADVDRILLMVHGTFSSTAGSFRGLLESDTGREFLAAARRRYGAIVGFDHRTLRLTPRQNAEDIVDALERALGRGMDRGAAGRTTSIEVDAIAFSRGGPVLRQVMALARSRALPLRFRRLIFVACANNGTGLARRENWNRLLDLTSTLATATFRATTWAATRLGGPAAIPVGVASKLLEASTVGVTSFVKLLAARALRDGGVPGLATMDPDGEELDALRREVSWIPDGAECAIITASFDIDLLPADEASQKEIGFTPRVVGWLAEGFMGTLMQGAENDLVVDRDSMRALGSLAPFDHFDFERQWRVYHTRYFVDPRTVRKLATWLGVDDELEALDDLDDLDDGDDIRSRGSVTRRGGTSGGSGDERNTARGARDASRGGSTTGSAPRSEEATALCHFRAECERQLQIGKVRSLRVAISRQALESRDDDASRVGQTTVELDRKIIVEVQPKQQLEIVGDDRAEVDVPAVGAPVELTFDLRGTHLGPAEVWVSIRQRTQALARLVVRTEIVESVGRGASAAPVVVEGNVPAPEREEVATPTLMIHEQRNGGELRYLFTLVLSDRRVFTGRSEPILGDRSEYVARLYAEIEERWISSRGDREAFAVELQARGVELFRELVPVNIQAAIWRMRDTINAITVLSEEPFIPWELVHPAPPPNPLGGRSAPPETMRFLGQMGLVRWLYGPMNPPQRLFARGGRVFHLVPAYPDPTLVLDAADDEREFLKRTFASQPAPVALAALQAFLRRGGFDVFHFAGHGEAEVGRTDRTRLLLEGRLDGSTWIPDSIGPSTIAAIFGAASESVTGPDPTMAADAPARPLILLNACQAGRSGWQLTSVGGFAEAFLHGNAGAFVGALWAVGDQPALHFGRALYTELRAGRRLAAATLAAREAARRAGDSTWLAYVVYGHPGAKLEV